MESLWLDLLPELQNEIRQTYLSPVDQQMLRLTCKSEALVTKPVPKFMLFWQASSAGSLGICKWIYSLCKDWVVPSNDPDDADDVPFLYQTQLFYDDALFYGHLEVAQWAFDSGLSIRASCVHHLIINNKFDSLKWAVGHGYELDADIPDLARDLTMIKWLVEVQHCRPSGSTIYEKIRCLPGSKDVLLYYLTLAETVVPPKCILHAVAAGRWDVLDFYKEHLPVQYGQVLEAWPMINSLHLARPDVPWKHYINLKTGILARDDFGIFEY
jgi:hypothetical protein